MFLFFSQLLSTCIKDFEGISFSILRVYQQKSLNLSDIEMTVSLHNYNFEGNLFNGDARQARQLIPFIQPKLGESKLSYILKVDAVPYPDECLVIELIHRETLLEAERLFTHRQQVYEKRLCPCPWLVPTESQELCLCTHP
jgi:hypothetical protein